MRLILVAALAIALAACGYSVRKSPALAEVRIGKIQNLGFEPALQDAFILALERELTRRGVRVDRSAGHSLEGSLGKVGVQGVAEADNVTVLYEISVSGTFRLVGPDGSARQLRGGGAFIVTFGGKDPLERLMSEREGALTRALEDLAAEVAASAAGTAP